MIEQAVIEHRSERHIWERMEPVWHVTFGVFAAAGAGLLATGAGPPGTRGTALLLLGAVVVAYVGLGGRALHREVGSAPGWIYVVLAVPLVLALFAVNPVGGGVLLFLLFPHLWRLLPTGPAVVATVLTMSGIVLAEMADADPADVPRIVGWMGGLLVVALLLGLWITRIARQSVRRAELIAQLEATRAELAAANRDVGALAERERLSREIHDTLAQGFAAIVLLSRADHVDPDVRLSRIRGTAQENLAESRALVAALAPTQLGTASLPAALARLVTRIGDELGVEATMRVDGVERPLPAAHDIVLLRVSQEALTNVRKHSGAAHVELTLGYADDAVALRVRDDGRGFDPRRSRDGYGLGGMRERVREVGGSLDVRAAPGAGTCVDVCIP